MCREDPVTKSGPGRRRWRRLLVAGLLVLLVAGAWLVRSRRDTAPWLPSKRLACVTPMGRNAKLQALPGRTHLMIGFPANGAPFQVVDANTGAVACYDPNWREPDWLVFPASADGTVWAVFVEGPANPNSLRMELRDLRDGQRRPIGPPLGAWIALCAYRPADETFALAIPGPDGAPELAVLSSSTGALRRLGRLGDSDAELMARYGLDWSPDASRLLVPFMSDGLLRLCDVGTGQVRRIGPWKAGLSCAAAVWWFGNDALLMTGTARRADGNTARLDLRSGTAKPMVALGHAEAPYPLGHRGGQPGGVYVLDASPDGQWFVAELVWVDSDRVAYRVARWLHRWAQARPRTYRLAAWLELRFLGDQRALFLFDWEGRIRWELPLRDPGCPGAAFLHDSRICWSDGDEIRIGDPNAARQ